MSILNPLGVQESEQGVLLFRYINWLGDYSTVKQMDLRKFRVPLIVLVLSAAIFSTVMLWSFLGDNESIIPSNLRFPSGIPLAFGSSSAPLVGEQLSNTIAVTGSGAASMQANEATVTLGVQTQDESASEAVRLNAEKMTAVIEAITILGVTEADMKTVSYHVYPVYAKDAYNVVIGYRVVNMIAVEVTNVELIGDVIDVAAENGANQIHGVSFGLSEESQEDLQRQAYLAALDAAEEKAELIVQRLGLRITGVLHVSESAYQPYQPYSDFRYASEGGSEPPTPIIEGTLSISATLYVIYSFE